MNYSEIKRIEKSKIVGGVSPAKQNYYYKINGKNVTKEEYNKYKNEPGNMEGGGKQTNDPDPDGRKAKIQSDREKLPRPATVLTEGQMKVKNQGTKFNKKPPFKARKGQSIGGVGRSPLHFNWRDALDRTQDALTVGGLSPGIGIFADAANTLISGGRAAYEGYKGNTDAAKKHLGDMAINAGAMVPVVGQGVAGTKLAVKAGQAGAKIAGKTGQQVAKQAVKKATVVGAKKGKDAIANEIKKTKQPGKNKTTILNKNQRPKASGKGASTKASTNLT